MLELSVVIIARNEAAVIRNAVRSARLLTDDVVVVDSGSLDDTVQLAESEGARVITVDWKGFGQTRNAGAAAALYDHLLFLDADEELTGELRSAIRRLQPERQVIYGFKRRNFLGRQEIRYGEWGNDHVYRLYHRGDARWNLVKVHETVVGAHLVKERIDGSVLHFTSCTIDEYQLKLDRYALLSAEECYQRGKRPKLTKILFSPGFSLLKNYLLRLGFLDGLLGWKLASMHAGYTRRKYSLIRSYATSLLVSPQ